MKLTFKEYKDKVRACWLGKNIGGTLGVPFECVRGAYDLDYYTHDLSLGVLPNDDLDLQLAWLSAAEKYGKNVNAEILADYWISYIVPDWSEYGACKNNLRYGILPPISGWYKNHNKDSCGCFIRSELWACLAPGHPEIAVKYAYEDAICDHADEGMYAELFCAALQSAAFVEKDMKKLVEIGKKFIPQDSDVAKAIDTAIECYENGKTWKEARKAVLQAVPGSFGMYKGYVGQQPEKDVPAGQLGYDAPSNIGLMMIGWAYGEGDFSKSVCIAAGCGEDADCSAGTLGATLGILYGTQAIDEKWLQPIGDEIKTISLDLTKSNFPVPKKVTELTRRVVNLMPTFMAGHFNINENGEFEFNEIREVSTGVVRTGTLEKTTLKDILCKSAVSVRKQTPTFEARLVYEDENLQIEQGIPKKFKLLLTNTVLHQQWLKMKLYIPGEWKEGNKKEMSVFLDNHHGGNGVGEYEFEIVPQTVTKGRYDVLLEIRSEGRASATYMPIVLLT